MPGRPGPKIPTARRIPRLRYRLPAKVHPPVLQQAIERVWAWDFLLRAKRRTALLQPITGEYRPQRKGENPPGRCAFPGRSRPTESKARARTIGSSDDYDCELRRL